MHIKTYLGPNTKTILAEIKEELGPDAVILSSRTVRRDDKNLSEVTAGVERDQVSGSGQPDGASRPDAARPAFFGPGPKNWQREWAQIRDHFMALLKPHMRLGDLTQRQRAALEYLQQEGVNDNAILHLYRSLVVTPHASILDPLSAMVPCRPWGLEEWPQRIHAVAGPAGVGKTVTALRLALALKAENPDMEVCLVNADTNKGHGRLVLKHYAELSDILYCEASSAKDLAKWAKTGREVDKFIIDLPTITRGDSLAAFMGRMGFVSRNMDVHLLLSPQYSGRQLSVFAEVYRSEHLASLVWTKLDEADTYGELVNVALNMGLPISALSVGASLTDSLVPAEKSSVWRLIFKHEMPKPPRKKEKAPQADAKSFAPKKKIRHTAADDIEEDVEIEDAEFERERALREETQALERSVLTPPRPARSRQTLAKPRAGERIRAKV